MRPQVDGIILERLFEEGSDVAMGQILYQIDASLYQADYDVAKAALDEAEAARLLNGSRLDAEGFDDICRLLAGDQAEELMDWLL